MSWLTEPGLPRKARQVPVMYRHRVNAEQAHVNYPHHPGALYDCPACEARCHCRPGETECVWQGHEQAS